MKIKKYLNAETLIPAGILILGLYLRVCNINHSLPYIFNHDGQNFIEQALRYGRGILRPLGFSHGMLFSYMLSVEYGVYFLANLFIGRMAGPADLLKEYILDPSAFIMIGRLTVVYFSLGSLFLVYLICRKFFDEKTGLAAMLFTSVSFYLAYLSHIVKEDIIVGFFLLCSFYYALKALEEKQYFNKPLYLSALFTGIAVSLKYYSFIGAVVMLLALAFKAKDNRIPLAVFFKIFLKAVFIITAVFLVLNPYVLIDAKRFMSQMLTLKGAYAASHDSYGRLSWQLYILFLKQGVSSPVFYLYLASLPAIFTDRRILLCNAYPAVLYIFLCFFKGAMPHFLASIIPFALISAAFLLTKAVSRFIKNNNSYGSIAVFFIAVALASSAFIASFKYCKILNGRDTRISAKAWIESNIKADSSILVEGAYSLNIAMGGPPLRENISTLKRELAAIRKENASGFLWENKIKYVVVPESPAYELYKTIVISPEDIKIYNPEYVILSNYHRFPALPAADAAKEYLKQRYACIKTILPDVYINFFPSFESLYYSAFEGMGRVRLTALRAFHSYGPVIEIYKRKI